MTRFVLRKINVLIPYVVMGTIYIYVGTYIGTTVMKDETRDFQILLIYCKFVSLSVIKIIITNKVCP